MSGMIFIDNVNYSIPEYKLQLIEKMCRLAGYQSVRLNYWVTDRNRMYHFVNNADGYYRGDGAMKSNAATYLEVTRLIGVPTWTFETLATHAIANTPEPEDTNDETKDSSKTNSDVTEWTPDPSRSTVPNGDQ